MSIRTKILLIIGATLLGLILILFVVSQTIVLQSYGRLEEEAVTLNVKRALNAFEDEIDFLHSTNRDYAHWDDTYAYIQGEGDGYVEANFIDSVFLNYRLNFVAFVNDDGEIVNRLAFDLVNQERVPFPDDLEAIISHNEAYVRPLDADGRILVDGIAGIVLLPEESILLAVVPILPSDLQGEPHGALIWGRSVDQSLIDGLAERTQLTLTISPATPSEIQSLTAAQPIVVQPASVDVVEGYTLLRAIDHQPVLILRSITPRSIYRQGQESLLYFIIALSLVGLISAGAIAVLLEIGVLSRLEYLNRHVSRIQVDGDLSARVRIGGNDELANLASNFNTMLESLQAQEKLKLARDNALEAARLKAEILANVSHDARTPLSVIMLRSEMLLSGVYGSLSPKQTEVLGTVLLSAQQLLGFVNNLLEGAQLDSGRLTLRIDAMQPAKLLETAKMMVAPLAAKKNLALEIHLQDDVPGVLFADEKRLEQILTNLVSNAIKFTDTGSIVIRVYRFDPDRWAMDVTDTGKGISLDHQRQIFNPFWQVDGSTTRAANSGVGLGLAIVQQLTELMGGEITVESTVGKGSRFTVILPIRLTAKGMEDGRTTFRLNH